MASTAHCAYCFETLVAALDESGQLSLNEVEKLYDRYQSADGQSPPSNRSEKYPLFVTLNTITKSGDKRLRGCIGTFEAQPLDVGLKTYTLAAAFEDHRFRAVTKKELPTLQCSITLLTDFEPVSDPLDWDLHVHGIRIKFQSGGRRYSATYLPDVALEQGWNKEQTILSLMEKSGWSGKTSDWRKMGIEVVRYQGKKAYLSYEEFAKFKAWTEESGKGQ